MSCDLSGPQGVGICACCTIFLVGIILFGVAWDTLTPVEYGIEYNANTLHLNQDQIFEEGRFFLGVGHSFIKFPRTVVPIKFSLDPDADASILSARTKDGLEVNLDISFNYKLRGTKDDLTALYLDFSKDYNEAFIKIGRNVCRDVAADFNAFEYFGNRTKVQDEMQRELTEAFDDVYADIDSFQLRNIALPDEFENAIQQTQIAKQDIEQAQAEKDQAIVKADTIILEAREEAKGILVTANATAEAVILNAEATAAALIAKVDAEQKAYETLRVALNLTDADQLLTYVWLQAIQETGTNNLVMDLKKPDLLY